MITAMDTDDYEDISPNTQSDAKISTSDESTKMASADDMVVSRPAACSQLQGYRKNETKPVNIIHAGVGDIHYHFYTDKGSTTTTFPSQRIKELKQLESASDGREPKGSGDVARAAPGRANTQPLRINQLNAGFAHLGAGDVHLNTNKGNNSASQQQTPASKRDPNKPKISVTPKKENLFITKVNQNTIKATAHDVRSTFKNLKKPDKNVYPQMSVISFGKSDPGGELDSEYAPNATFNLKPGLDEQPVTVEQLHEGNSHHTMILGDTGDGKTTLAMRYTKLVLDGEVEALKDVKMVHFIRASKLHSEDTSTAFDLLFSQQISDAAGVTPELNQSGMTWVRNNPGKVLLVIDGLDQCAEDFNTDYGNISLDTKAKPNAILYNLFRGWIYPGMFILSTTRWHVYWRMTQDAKPARTIALRGYDPATAEYLLSSFAGDKGTEILNYLKANSQIVLSLCEIPMFLIFVSEVMTQEVGSLPDSLSSILISVLSCFECSPHKTANGPELLKKLMKIAYNGIKSKKVLFNHSYITSLGLDVSEIHDLVITDATPDATRYHFRVIDGNKEFYFCHQSIQELLAALHICSMGIGEWKENLSALDEPHMEVVQKLVYGILLNDKNLEKAKKFLKEVPRDLEAKRKMAIKRIKSVAQKKRIMDIKTLSLLHESGHLIQHTYESAVQEINLTNVFLKPTDVHAVLSVAQHCTHLKTISFGNLHIDSKSFTLFKKCLETLDNVKIKSLRVCGHFVDEDFSRFWTKCVAAGSKQLYLDGFSVEIVKKNEMNALVKRTLSKEEVTKLCAVLKTGSINNLLLSGTLSAEFMGIFNESLKAIEGKVNLLEIDESMFLGSEAYACLSLFVVKKVRKLSMRYCDLEVCGKQMKVETNGKLSPNAFVFLTHLLGHLNGSTTIHESASLDSVLLVLKEVDLEIEKIDVHMKAPWLQSEKGMVCHIKLECNSTTGDCLSSENSHTKVQSLKLSTNHSKSSRTFIYLARLIENSRVGELTINRASIQVEYDLQSKVEALVFPDTSSEDHYLDFILETDAKFVKTKGFKFGIQRHLQGSKGKCCCFIVDGDMITSDCAHALWQSTKADEIALKINGLRMAAAWDDAGRIKSLKVPSVKSEKMQTLQSVIQTMADLAQVTIHQCVIDTIASEQAVDELKMLEQLAVYHCIKVQRLEVAHAVSNITKIICTLLTDTKLKTANICGVEFDIHSDKDGKADVLDIKGGITDARHLIEIIQEAKIRKVRCQDFEIMVFRTPAVKNLHATRKNLAHNKSYTSLFNFMKKYEANSLKIKHFLLTSFFTKGLQLQRVNLSFDWSSEWEKDCFAALCHFVVNSGARQMKINDIFFSIKPLLGNKAPEVEMDTLQRENFTLLEEILSVVEMTSLSIRQCEIVHNHQDTLEECLDRLQCMSSQTALKIGGIDVKGYPYEAVNQVFGVLKDAEIGRFRVFCETEEGPFSFVHEEPCPRIDQITLSSLSAFMKAFDTANAELLVVTTISCTEHELISHLWTLKDILHCHLVKVQVGSLIVQGHIYSIMQDIMEFVKIAKVGRVWADSIVFSVTHGKEKEHEDIHIVVEFLQDIGAFRNALVNIQVPSVTITEYCITSTYLDEVTEELEAIQSLQSLEIDDLEISTLDIEDSFYEVACHLTEIILQCRVKCIKTTDLELKMDTDESAQMRNVEVDKIAMDGVAQLMEVLEAMGVKSIKLAHCCVGPLHHLKTLEKIEAIPELTSIQLEMIREVLASTNRDHTLKHLEILQRLAQNESLDTKVGFLELQSGLFAFAKEVFDVAKRLQVNRITASNEKFNIDYSDDGEMKAFTDVWTCCLAKFCEMIDGTEVKHVAIQECHIKQDEVEEELKNLANIVTQESKFKVSFLKLDNKFADSAPALVDIIKQSYLEHVEASDMKLKLQRDKLGKHVGLETERLSDLCGEEIGTLLKKAGLKCIHTPQCFIHLDCNSAEMDVLLYNSEKTTSITSHILGLAGHIQTETILLPNLTMTARYDTDEKMTGVDIEEVGDENWLDFTDVLQFGLKNVVKCFCFETLRKLAERLPDLQLTLGYDNNVLEIKELKIARMNHGYLNVIKGLFDIAKVGKILIWHYTFELNDEMSISDQLQHLQYFLHENCNVQIDAFKIPSDFCSVKYQVLNIMHLMLPKHLELLDGECTVEYDEHGKVTKMALSSLDVQDAIELMASVRIKSLEIGICHVPYSAIERILREPLLKLVQVHTFDVQSRFYSFIAHVKELLSLTKAECLRTYDGPVKVTYDDAGKVESLQFQCLNVRGWQKCLLNLKEFEFPCLKIGYLQIKAFSGEKIMQELEMAQRLANDDMLSTEIGCIDFQDSLMPEAVEPLMNIARKTLAKRLKTRDVEFCTEACSDGETLCMQVASLDEKGTLRLFASLLNENTAAAADIDMLLTRLKTFLNSVNIKLKIGCLKLERNFCKFSKLVITIAKVTEMREVKMLDADLRFHFGVDGEVTCMDITNTCNEQMKTFVKICKTHKIRNLSVWSWQVVEDREKIADALLQLQKLLCDDDVAVKVNALKVFVPFFRHANALIKLAERLQLARLETSDEVFEFHYDDGGKVSTSFISVIRSHNLGKFIDMFRGVEVTVKEIILDMESTVLDSSVMPVKKVIDCLHNQRAWKVECVTFQQDFVSTSVQVMEMLHNGFCHIKASDIEFNVCLSTAGEIDVVEVLDEFRSVGSQVVEIIKLMKPQSIKLYDYEMELTYYENGTVRMDAVQNYNLWKEVCQDLQSIAKDAGMKLLLVKDCDLTQHECKLRAGKAYNSAGYEYFTEYTPRQQHASGKGPQPASSIYLLLDNQEHHDGYTSSLTCDIYEDCDNEVTYDDQAGYLSYKSPNPLAFLPQQEKKIYIVPGHTPNPGMSTYINVRENWSAHSLYAGLKPKLLPSITESRRSSRALIDEDGYEDKVPPGLPPRNANVWPDFDGYEDMDFTHIYD